MGGYNPPEVGLHALNSSFPKNTKVGCTLRNESPFDVLVGAELGYFLLCLLAFEKIGKFLELSGSANKICSVVTPNDRRLATARNEPLESGYECIRGEVRSETSSK